MPGAPEFQLVGWECGRLIFGSVLCQRSQEATYWPGNLPEPSHHWVLLRDLAGRHVEKLALGNLRVSIISYREQTKRAQERLHRRESLREVEG
jgi:hypothetical protein